MSDMRESSSVQVIDRAFAVLEFVSLQGVASLKDIYTALGLNKASTLRIANALVCNGYLDKNPKGNYSLTFKSYELGIRAVRRVDYITFIRETLDNISTGLGVIAQFSVREQNELLCIESFDQSRANFSIYTRVGQRSQLYATSAGKAILSTYRDDDIAALWNQLDIRAYTPNTIVRLDDFMKEIYLTRQRHFAIDDEESELGLFCVGTPLINSSQNAIGAISLSTNIMNDNILQRLSSDLLSQTQRLSYMLSYSIK